MSVLVVLEQHDGKWNRISFEALAAGQKIAQTLNLPVSSVLLGAGISALANEAATYATNKVFIVDHVQLAQYTPEGYTAALEELIRSVQPKAVVFPHTYQVRDYAPKLSTRFGKPLVSDVIDLKIDNQSIVFVRQLFQGKLNVDVRPMGDPQFVSVQAGAFRAAERAHAEPGHSATSIEKVVTTIDASKIRSKPEEPFREAQRSVDLGAADRIVSVGRGIKEKENLPIVEALAKALGAELAASRPICDNGWLPMERQVGSSGQTVSPKLYFAVGISGAIQHLVGMKGSKTVVAINKDENAPIFETADYGVVGDLFEVVPALVEEIEKTKV